MNEARKQRTFFVRVATRTHVDLLLVVPEDWLPDEVSRTDTREWSPFQKWLRVPRDEDVDLTVASTVLPDGTFFQVGRSGESREKLLASFRLVFALIIPLVMALGFLGAHC